MKAWEDLESDCLGLMPSAKTRNRRQAPRKAKVLPPPPTHTHPDPPARVPQKVEMEPHNPGERSRSTRRVAANQARGACHLGASARVGRQSTRAEHWQGYRAFILEPATSGPKQDTDTDLGTHPQPSRLGYLHPEPSGSQPAAKRKHVGKPNYSRSPEGAAGCP